MPTREEAKRLVRRLHALSGSEEIVRKAAARELARWDPLEATELLDQIIALSRAGWAPATTVLRAFVAALDVEREQIPHAPELRRLATIQGLDAVADLFPRAPAQQELDEDAAARMDSRLFTRSLGHLKQQARLERDPDTLARLVTASNPAVVRNALANPRLTEPLVVRMAARRPVRPEPLLEIWRHPRWSSRHAVRRALVFNPYLPPEVGAKIVPLLTKTDLQELVADTSVHPMLREQAARLLMDNALG